MRRAHRPSARALVFKYTNGEHWLAAPNCLSGNASVRGPCAGSSTAGRLPSDDASALRRSQDAAYSCVLCNGARSGHRFVYFALHLIAPLTDLVSEDDGRRA